MMCLPVLELQAVPAGQLKQAPFSSENKTKKMASFFTFFYFILLFHVLYLSLSHVNVSSMCLPPTTNNVCFSHEAFVVGIHVNAGIQTVPLFIHAAHLRWDLTAFCLLLAVEPPSDLKFKILNENTVEMSWIKPSVTIEGFRIQVVSDAGKHEGSTRLIRKTPQCSCKYTIFFSRWTSQRFYPECRHNNHLHHQPDSWLGLHSDYKLLWWIRGEHPYLWTTDKYVHVIYLWRVVPAQIVSTTTLRWITEQNSTISSHFP